MMSTSRSTGRSSKRAVVVGASKAFPTSPTCRADSRSGTRVSRRRRLGSLRDSSKSGRNRAKTGLCLRRLCQKSSVASLLTQKQSPERQTHRMDAAAASSIRGKWLGRACLHGLHQHGNTSGCAQQTLCCLGRLRLQVSEAWSKSRGPARIRLNGQRLGIPRGARADRSLDAIHELFSQNVKKPARRPLRAAYSARGSIRIGRCSTLPS